MQAYKCRHRDACSSYQPVPVQSRYHESDDKLDRIFELQRKFDERVARQHNTARVLGVDLPEGALATLDARDIIRDRWLQAEILAMFSELAELLRLTSFKWWKKPTKLDRDAVTEELVDLLHFFVSTCIKMGISADDLYRAYLKKNRENHRRQSEVPGYAVAMDSETTEEDLQIKVGGTD